MRRILAIVGAALVPAAALAGVVGSGTPSSCTEAALAAQLSAGGTVTFNCGDGPQSIAFTSTLIFLSTFPKVTIDGNDTITLDGTGLTTGMVSVWGSATVLPDVTFRHITFANGNITTGLNAGGAIQNFGKLTLDTVTFRNNHAAGSGGIFQEPCTGCLEPSLMATHCLFENNSTGGGSAISMQGGIAAVEDSTFSGNSAPGAGAIEVQFGDATCSGASVANPLLAPLADNGGATRTMALAAGSAAIDAADTALAPATDQRGAPRTDGNGDGVVAADIGSFEAAGTGGPPPPRRHRAVRP